MRVVLLALTLAGTPREVLLAAQRREMHLPTLAIGALALLLADRASQPVLDRASTDLSERE